MLYNDSNATSINDRSISRCPDQNSMTICPGAKKNETVHENLMATIPEAYMCWKYLSWCNRKNTNNYKII